MPRLQYEVGSAHHKVFLTAKENRITGSHTGWAVQGDLSGVSPDIICE